jgi:hypothetical protein
MSIINKRQFILSINLMIIILFTYSLTQQNTLSFKSASADLTIINPNLRNIQFIQLDPTISPYMQQQILQKAEQMRQKFIIFEQQLAMSNPQQQQFMIASLQQSFLQGLLQLPPQEIPMMIQIMQQVMSPQLQQILLIPIVSQLNLGFVNPNPQIAPKSIDPPQSTNKRTFNSPLTGPSIEESQQSIEESQRKIEQTDRLINQWDSLYPPDWADSFGTFGD